MKVWLPILVALLLAGGCLIVGLALLRRRQAREQQPDLVPRWKAFLTSEPREGEPAIPPAQVPAVKQLQARTVDRCARFRARLVK